MHETTPANPDPRTVSDTDHLAAAARQAELDGSLDQLRERLASVLPEFELGEVIGRGGMGAVFRARQRTLDRTVAVKALLPPPGEVDGWAERFRREARALARLQHPGIVTLFDYGQSGDLAWLVMELVEGTDLRSLMGEERLTPAEALAIVPPVCEALQYAHERGIVHRDIKPENVLLDVEGRVRLVDFGLAKVSVDADDPNLTRTGQAMGTPRYMAPEQLERPLEVDHRADIFSLGVVLYEMLTGQVPAGVVEPPSRKVDVNVRLDEVVLRALQREPERRYQSAADLEHGVEQAGSQAPEPPPAASEAEPVVPPTSSAPTGPIRSGLTLADLIALAMFPVALVSLGPFDSVVPSGLWDFQSMLMMLQMLWLVLPAATIAHWGLGRLSGRPLRISMPVVRVLSSLMLLALSLTLVEGFIHQTLHMDFGEPERYRREAIGVIARWIVVLGGLSAAALGAWSAKGAHRRLLAPDIEKALVALTSVLVAIATSIAVTATFGDTVRVSQPAGFGSSLPFTLMLPVFVTTALSIPIARGGSLRSGLMIFVLGAIATLTLHLLMPVRYGDWSVTLIVTLMAATGIGLFTVAATAEPIPVDDPARA